MKKMIVSLLVAASVGSLPVIGAASTVQKKTTASAKKEKAAGSAHKAAKPSAKASKKASKQPVAAVPARHAGKATVAKLSEDGKLVLQSSAALIQDQATGAVLYEKNSDAVVPIASISKLMTAMVSLDAKPSLDEVMTITDEDVDVLKGTHSRLKVGTQLTKEEMLRLALMSSENRAAAALSRYYPGGREAFVAAMNRKSQSLGLSDTHFQDSTGLTAANVSSARDLVKMVNAAHHYPLIREFTTTAEYDVNISGRPQTFRNTNPLVRTQDSNDWEIGLSKTGFINEAGKCLVMQAWVNNKPTIIVLLDSWGKLTRIGDAIRVKRWMESAGLSTRSRAG